MTTLWGTIIRNQIRVVSTLLGISILDWGIIIALQQAEIGLVITTTYIKTTKMQISIIIFIYKYIKSIVHRL